jgi:hypothetical protein
MTWGHQHFYSHPSRTVHHWRAKVTGDYDLSSRLWSDAFHRLGIGLKSEDGVEGKNDEIGDPWLLGCPRACDIQDLNRVLRQLFELLSAVLIVSRQMNPRLVMFLGELGGFLRAARQFGCERK